MARWRERDEVEVVGGFLGEQRLFTIPRLEGL
jgi:hypothetical protein